MNGLPKERNVSTRRAYCTSLRTSVRIPRWLMTEGGRKEAAEDAASEEEASEGRSDPSSFCVSVERLVSVEAVVVAREWETGWRSVEKRLGAPLGEEEEEGTEMRGRRRAVRRRRTRAARRAPATARQWWRGMGGVGEREGEEEGEEEVEVRVWREERRGKEEGGRGRARARGGGLRELPPFAAGMKKKQRKKKEECKKEEGEEGVEGAVLEE